jgi:uncharacterized protein YndB with AHSA1/START domain
MTTQTQATSVSSSIEVRAPIDRAFNVFTEDMGSWWPSDHHILQAPLAGMVFEPRVGGEIIDRGTDGSECRWARVLAYEPPTLVVFSWDITLGWQVETEHAHTSEVEVRFTAKGNDRTLVEIEHRHLERHGEGWEAMRNAVGSDGGWLRGLIALKERLES